jgi:hypothetical protein
MERYANLNGDSGVVAFSAANNSICVLFKDGTAYEYTDSSAGAGNVAQMVVLARRGFGLNTFISQHVRDCFARKFRQPR